MNAVAPRIISRSEHPVSRQSISPNALRVLYRLKEAGYQAFLVGGCVRDILLQREPADYDVATDATPDQVQRIFPRSLSVGAQFGVMVVLDDSVEDDPAQVEVATFRSDVGYSDGQSSLSEAGETRHLQQRAGGRQRVHDPQRTHRRVEQP